MNPTVIIGDCQLYLGDCQDVLPHLPKVDAVITDLAAGAAGEHLVCADLLIQGYRAFLTDQNCPYDVAVEINGKLIRIQVKSTRKPHVIKGSRAVNHAYMWHVRRAGKGASRVYGEDDFDLLALVALDSRQIAYLPPSKIAQTIHIRTHNDPRAPANGGKSGKTFSQYSFISAFSEVING